MPLANHSMARTRTLNLSTGVHQMAAQIGVPTAQLALAWMLSKPGITAPIVGASKPGHIEDAVAALSVKLKPEQVKSLAELYQPHPVLGFS